MAGQGFKDFSVGEVLTSADVDGYLMQQSVMRFADSAARGSALGTATGTAVPLAEGMITYLDDVNQVQVFDGTAWAATGKVLEVVQTVKTDTFTTTSGTFVTVTGMTVTITPSSNTNKVLVLLDARINADTSAAAAFARLMRDSTPIYIGDTAGSRTRVLTAAGSPATQVHTSVSGIYLDSPATTSPVTYSLEIRSNTAAGVGVNVAASDTDATNRSRAASSITVIEVAA